ncbi:SoxR reducing system RseC family protein [Seminibacterium arietis]|uniref:SoxR reducing system RseC family protein n=1 Tax=Seminibacterium arietis TaxID=1173502 RepID=A0ABW3IA89_9PAST
MLKEHAVVINYKSTTATVKCQSKTACGECAAKSSCGSTALSQLNGSSKEHIFTIESSIPLQKGQIVEIGLPKHSLISSVLLLYFLPLSVILISTLVADYLFQREWQNVVFIFFCTALSFIIVRLIAKKLHQKSNYQPILLRIK